MTRDPTTTLNSYRECAGLKPVISTPCRVPKIEMFELSLPGAKDLSNKRSEIEEKVLYELKPNISYVYCK